MQLILLMILFCLLCSPLFAGGVPSRPDDTARCEGAVTFLRDHAGTKLIRFDGRELHEIAEQP